MQTAFISYGGPDETFAGLLNEVLNSAGIKTYFFPKDAQPGQKLHHLMRNGVNTFDKVIFICSKNSLNRLGVINELEETLQREAREGGKQILIPITIDNYVFTKWEPDIPGLKQTILDRVVGNFTRIKNNKVKLINASQKLVKALGGELDISFLSYDFSMSINSTGRKGDWLIGRTFIPHYEIKTIVYSGLNSTGQIIPKSTSNGKITSTVVEGGGAKTVYISFEKPLPINEVFTNTLRLDNIDAFLSNKEDYSFQAAYSCDIVNINLYFPKSRPIKSALLKCIANGKTTVIDSLKINKEKTHINLSLKKPQVGSNYIIIWEW